MGVRSAKAGWAVVLGVLSIATMPVAVGSTRFSESYDLLKSGFAIPLGLALGIAAVMQARRVRAQDSATLGRSGGRKAARVARLLGIVGICIACSALIAVAVYGVLAYVGSR
jgi:hypothetical protein